MDDSANIVLIGMAGVGKSTVGVLLAKALSRTFVDTDLVIQSSEGRRLQDIIDAEGVSAFRGIEERHVLAIDCLNAVIATGGSVVYSDKAMAHLKASGVTIHLDLPMPELSARLTNADFRGLVIAPGQSIEDLYGERGPLYRRHADLTVDCSGLSHEQVLTAVVELLYPCAPESS